MSSGKEFVKDLMSKMTLREKIGQLYQTSYDGGVITGPQFQKSNIITSLKKGEVGSVLGLWENDVLKKLQDIATSETNMKIPLMNCFDVIHGCKTLLPINLAMSCSWNPDLIRKANKMVAFESTHSGVDLTFAPMLDLARDPRWGRVMECNGEDPYLSSVLARAEVNGFHDGGLATCAKHYVGYGACVGGRDYDAVDMSTTTLFNYYLPPFKAAVNSGTEMVMTSFNSFNGIPSSVNDYLLRHCLRKKLKFDGVIISDWASMMETINHKVAFDEKEVAKKSIIAGVDHEMVTTCYIDYLEELVKEKEIPSSLIDEACFRVLLLKYKLGLFDDPYKNIQLDEDKYFLTTENKKVAYDMANESICLLENDGTLPLKKKTKVAFVGPYIDEKKVVGAWGGKVNFNDTITILEALEKGNYNYVSSKGLEMFNENPDLYNKALDDIKNSDVIVYTMGEEQWMSGESHSRATLSVIDAHDKVLDELLKLGKKIVLVFFSGRPLVLSKYKKLYEEGKVQAILYAWFLGTMSGEAIVDTIYGKNNPSGKITMSFPRDVGQIPVYYNHLPSGRPNIPNTNNDYRLRYIDMDISPLYPFGYGLSYSKFKYSDVSISTIGNKINVEVEIENTSNIKGKEIVELYIEAPSGIVARPVKELKGFKKITLKANEKKKVIFSLDRKDLMYYYEEKLVSFSGIYKIFVGANSSVEDYKQIQID